MKATPIPATSQFFQEQEALRRPRPAGQPAAEQPKPRRRAADQLTLRPFYAEPMAVGRKYGRWTVIAADGYCIADGRPVYTCRCVCGEEAMRRVSDLKSGRSNGCRSCAMRARNANRGDAK